MMVQQAALSTWDSSGGFSYLPPVLVGKYKHWINTDPDLNNAVTENE